MAATTVLREALNKGISSGNLIDTKIILYSHRESSGRVSQPKALYASSHVLKTVSYFDGQSQSKDFNEAVDEEEYAEDYGYLSDSDLEDSEDEKASKPTANSKTHPLDLPGKDKIVCEGHEERVEKGKVVKIPDMAFVTFQAFLMYLYTDAIEFAPFGSEQNRRSRSAEIANPSEDKVPRPSPKSIYRLADKYDVPALRTLALNQIRGELSKCDIVEESFSRFASQYDEIRSVYVEQLAYIWVDDSTEATRTSIEKKIDSFGEGNLEHAAEMVSALWKKVNTEGEVTAPSNTSSAAAPVKGPAHWDSVKIALIKSIRKGVFFDRKYWARHSDSWEVLKPVHFSSTIMKDKTEELNKMVKYLVGQNTLSNDLGDVNVESDCEGDAQRVDEGSQEAKEDEKEPVRAVLVVGSFSAWKSLFFYRCTDEILFAPLKSQGVDSRLKYIRENTVEAAPPPCSPKSIYVLANLLEIKPLCDTALADIKSKVTLDNVVDEVFSWVTAAEEKIMEMESEIFIPNLKDPKLIGLVSDNIGRIADGSSPHGAGALKLGLKKAVESKKQSRGVLLRCPRNGCLWFNTPAAYASVGANIYCPYCYGVYGGYYLQCVGCSYQRTSSYASCQSCQKKFI
ncbi:hypothetical protein BJ322DRAFT_830823 [Thelephora terrestris]|uniref:BTB domain-containing protein n=1 Tax=Thelephora terrestris TaxID=56493 RepID=A0A9P6HHG3_9AGAM|nr:hypothetical protein BJ322DRAFT_830823 [Thelephora terrestris]